MTLPKLVYVSADLAVSAEIDCPKPLYRRLTKVLRLKQGAELRLFNGRDGLFTAQLGEQNLLISDQLAVQPADPGCTLFIGLLKRDAMDRVLRQAAECSVTQIQPLLLDYTVPDKLNMERAQDIILEACEQCERLTIPSLAAPAKLTVLADFQHPIYWCNERTRGQWNVKTQADSAILIGPEGGFSPNEQEFLMGQKQVIDVGLGPHILRADTAVVAACSRWQQNLA